MPGGFGNTMLRPAPLPAPISVPEADRPDFIESVGPGFRVANDEIEQTQRSRLREGYGPIVRALEERGEGSSWWTFGNVAAIVLPFQDHFDHDAVWSAVERVRAREPGAFPDLPRTRDEFEQQVLTRNGARAADQQALALGSGAGGFVGAVGAQFLDPLNLATMPIGGGARTIGQAILRESVINAAIEGVQQVPLARARERMGEELTGEEVALNIGAGLVFGGVLGGLTKGAGDNWDAIRAAPRDVQERLWGTILDRAPGLRERIGSGIDGPTASLLEGGPNWDALDDSLPELAEAMIGADRMTLDEQAAIAGIRREQVLRAASPFADNAAGRGAHMDGMAAALRQIMDDAPELPPLAIAPVSRADLTRTTAISSGAVPGDARSVVKARIAQVESAGDAAARNPNSSATGLYQFTSGTWLRLYKNRYGAGGLSDADILAKRTDTRLQNALMDDLVDLNVRALERAGISPTAGNIYLAHFAGSSGATALHRARPEASAASVLGNDAVRANPFLRGMSAADVIAWANAKMGGRRVQGAPVRSAREELEDGLETLAAERADIEAAMAGTRDNPAPLEDAASDLPEMEPVDLRAPDLSEEAQDTLPVLRRAVEDRRLSLNRTAELAQELGLSEVAVRQGLTRLAALGEVRSTAKGLFVRHARPAERGPDDMIRFIARNGGISYDGLDAGGRRLGTGGHDLRNTGNLSHFVPGAGPLLRPNGRSLDAMGELLWDAGYFGPPAVTPRPTESELIAAIDDVLRTGEKRFAAGDTPPGDDIPFDPAEAVFGGEFERWERAAVALFGDSYDPEDLILAAQMREDGALGELPLADLDLGGADLADGADLAPYLIAMVNRNFDDVLDDALMEAEDEFYELVERQFRDAVGRETAPGRGGGSRSAPDGGNEGEGAQGGQDRPGASDPAQLGRATDPFIESGPIDPARYQQFDDPNGSAAQMQAESAVHDVRVDLDRGAETDPAIVDRQRQQAQLGAEAPMRARVEQDGVMGSPLFDAADQPGFRFDDEGDAMNAADMLADLDEDSAMLKSIRDCL